MGFQKELDFRSDYKEISVFLSTLHNYFLQSYLQHISLSGYLPTVTSQPDESNEGYLSEIRKYPICRNYSNLLHKEKKLPFFLYCLHSEEEILL